MPLMLFNVSFDTQNPSMLLCDARAVPAEPRAQLGDDAGNPGGVTRGDIADADIRAVGENGSDVYVEGDPEDVLEDEGDATTLATRVWWRAPIGGVGS
jgi:hypothetical protein